MHSTNDKALPSEDKFISIRKNLLELVQKELGDTKNKKKVEKLQELTDKINSIHSYAEYMCVMTSILLDENLKKLLKEGIKKLPFLEKYTFENKLYELDKKVKDAIAKEKIPDMRTDFRNHSPGTWRMAPVDYPSMSTWLDNQDLNKLLNVYLDHYQRQHAETVVRRLNYRALVNSTDNAIVYFEVEAPIIDQTKGILARQIAYSIQRCFAKFLAFDMDPETLPNTLRLCLFVNHNKVHWTGLIVDVENYLPLYQAIYAAQKQFPESRESVRDLEELSGQVKAKKERLLFGKKEELIIRTIDSMISPEFWTQHASLKKITQDFIPLETLLTFFKQHHLSLNISHYDSYFRDKDNKTGYEGVIEDAIEVINKLLKVNFKYGDCPKQENMTCGDNTLFNLYIKGVENISPKEFAKVDSHSRDLRTLMRQVHQQNPTKKNPEGKTIEEDDDEISEMMDPTKTVNDAIANDALLDKILKKMPLDESDDESLPVKNNKKEIESASNETDKEADKEANDEETDSDDDIEKPIVNENKLREIIHQLAEYIYKQAKRDTRELFEFIIRNSHHGMKNELNLIIKARSNLSFMQDKFKQSFQYKYMERACFILSTMSVAGIKSQTKGVLFRDLNIENNLENCAFIRKIITEKQNEFDKRWQDRKQNYTFANK